MIPLARAIWSCCGFKPASIVPQYVLMLKLSKKFSFIENFLKFLFEIFSNVLELKLNLFDSVIVIIEAICCFVNRGKSSSTNFFSFTKFMLPSLKKYKETNKKNNVTLFLMFLKSLLEIESSICQNIACL